MGLILSKEGLYLSCEAAGAIINMKPRPMAAEQLHFWPKEITSVIPII